LNFLRETGRDEIEKDEEKKGVIKIPRSQKRKRIWWKCGAFSLPNDSVPMFEIMKKS
jgi:hypothetical protein